MARAPILLRAALLILAAAGFVDPSSAAPDPSSPVQGVLQPPVVTAFDISPPLRDLLRAAPPGVEMPAMASSEDRAGDVVSSPLNSTMPLPSVNFAALGNTCNCAPPEPSIAVGPNHVVLVTNLSFGIYNRSGGLITTNLNKVLWSGFGGDCEINNAGLPRVLYDRAANRWFVTQLANYTAPYFGFCMAVSTTGDPLGSWYRWHVSTGSTLPDVAHWSIWPDAYYLSFHGFINFTVSTGVSVYAFNRAHLLAGLASPAIVSMVASTSTTSRYNYGDGLLPVNVEGSLPPPAGSPGLFLGMMDNDAAYGAPQDALTLWRFHADFVTPANSTFTLASTLPTESIDTAFGCVACITQVETSQRLDGQTRWQRPAPRVIYRNFGTHQAVVAQHPTEVSPGLTGIRWYEIRNPHGTPVIHQQGVHPPSNATGGMHRFMAGIDIDRSGNIALAYSVSALVPPSIWYTGRLVTDPLGTMPKGEPAIISPLGCQTGSNKWGYHSWMTIDPLDDCTFWYTNEYVPVTSPAGWVVRIAAFKYPECGPSVAVEEGVRPERTELLVHGPPGATASMEIRLAGPASSRVELDVVDVGGRRVRMLLTGTLPPGSHPLSWDGRTDGGAAGSGVYFARLRVDERLIGRSLVLLR